MFSQILSKNVPKMRNLPNIFLRSFENMGQGLRMFEIQLIIWRTTSSYFDHTEKKTHAVWSSGQNGWVDRRQENSDCSSPEWRRPVERPYTYWMATLKNDLALHNLTLEDAIELALNKPLWRLLSASGATHWWCMPNNDDDDDMKMTVNSDSDLSARLQLLLQ